MYRDAIKTELIKHDRFNPIKAATLAKVVGLKETDTTCPTTRDHITGLIADGLPVAAGNSGFFLINAAGEMQTYLNSLMKRQIALSQRILNVHNACKKAGIV